MSSTAIVDSTCNYSCEDSLGINLAARRPGEPGYSPVLTMDDFREDEKVHERAKGLARMALETFKDDSGKQYELVEVLLFDWGCDFEFRVYFSAKPKDAPKDDVKTLRAIIELFTVDGNPIIECVFKTPYRTLPPISK